MEYVVDRIPGKVIIDPDAGGQGHQRKRERPAQQAEGDSVSISDEARRRSTEAEGGEPGETPVP